MPTFRVIFLRSILTIFMEASWYLNAFPTSWPLWGESIDYPLVFLTYDKGFVALVSFLLVVRTSYWTKSRIVIWLVGWWYCPLNNFNGKKSHAHNGHCRDQVIVQIMYHNLSSWALQGHRSGAFPLVHVGSNARFRLIRRRTDVFHHAWLLLMLICIRKCEAGSIRWVSCIADRACRLIWLINLIETSEIRRHGTLSTLVQVLTCCLFEAKPLPANFTRWDTVALLSTEPMGTDLKWNLNQYTVLTRNSKCRL